MRSVESLEILRPEFEFDPEYAPGGELCLRYILTLLGDRDVITDPVVGTRVVQELAKAAGPGPRDTAIFSCQVKGCDVSIQVNPEDLMETKLPHRSELDNCIVER